MILYFQEKKAIAPKIAFFEAIAPKMTFFKAIAPKMVFFRAIAPKIKRKKKQKRKYIKNRWFFRIEDC